MKTIFVISVIYFLGLASSHLENRGILNILGYHLMHIKQAMNPIIGSCTVAMQNFIDKTNLLGSEDHICG
jgi:hypothetical protein